MKDAKDFDVKEFIPDGSTTGTTAPPVFGDATRPVKRNVSREVSELTGRNEATGQTAPTLSSEQPVPSYQTVPAQPIESPQQNGSTQPAGQVQATQPTAPTQPHRVSSRHRRASLYEYREVLLTIPKITDRQPVFVSRTTRDKIDWIVRLLGERRMSVSEFLETLCLHHLDLYADDLEQWRRL